MGADKYILTTGTGDVTSTRKGAVQQGAKSDLEGALSQATGWPVLQGWRLRFENLTGPVVLQSGRGFGDVEVIDPEDLRFGRANIEWGETPERSRDDVATLSLSKDRKRLEITPGQTPTGVVFIQGHSESILTGCDGEAVAIGESVTVCGQSLAVVRGAYLRERSGTSLTVSEPDPVRTDALKALGYLE